MAAPQVNWRNAFRAATATTPAKAANLEAVPSWNIGTIDAGSPSDDFGVLIWNNWTGANDLSTMTNCTITTKDKDGNNLGELVLNKWIEVTVVSAGDAARHKIGGDTKYPIQAGGNTVNGDGTFSPNANEILGVKNDGNYTNSRGNYAEVILRAAVPGNATAGNVAFLTRVAYQYV